MAKPSGVSFVAAFAPNRKSLTLDTDGECCITLVIPESDAPKVVAAFQVLKDESFRVTFEAEK